MKSHENHKLKLFTDPQSRTWRGQVPRGDLACPVAQPGDRCPDLPTPPPHLTQLQGPEGPHHIGPLRWPRQTGGWKDGLLAHGAGAQRPWNARGWPGWWMNTRTCRPNCQILRPPAFVSGLERGWGLSQHLTTWRLPPDHGAPRWSLGLLT